MAHVVMGLTASMNRGLEVALDICAGTVGMQDERAHSEAYRLIAGLVLNQDTRDLSLHQRFCLQLTILVISLIKD